MPCPLRPLSRGSELQGKGLPSSLSVSVQSSGRSRRDSDSGRRIQCATFGLGFRTRARLLGSLSVQLGAPGPHPDLCRCQHSLAN
eukprot:12622503-Alexandrium_andersonii.AAC.1